jgi:hypothetical protein
MKFPRLLASLALAALFSTTLVAQQPSTGYHTVVCLKVKPDMGSEFSNWAANEMHKVSQARVDSGQITTWFLLRASVPAGSAAECDYLVIALYPGAPRMLGPTDLSAALKKANLALTTEEYAKHRNALSTIVSTAVFQNRVAVGVPKKGDYFVVNYFKVHGDIQEWVDYEKKVWQPFAEALDQDGMTDGWSLNVQVMPRGTDLPYDAVTVDIYPSMDAVFKEDPKFYDRWRRVHPDMELGTTFEQFEKLGPTVMTRAFELEDLITAK